MDRSITIMQYVGVGVTREVVSVYPTADSVHKIELQKTDNITLKFNLAEPIVIERGMFIEWDGVKYFVNNTFKPTYSTNNGAYTYNVQFDAWYYFWNRYLFVLNPTKGANETSFTYTSTIEEVFKLIIDNLEMYRFGNEEKEIVADETIILPNPKCTVHFIDGSVVTYGYSTKNGVKSWTILGGESYKDETVEPNTKQYVENKAVLYTFDATHVTDALTTIAKAAECEWWMEDNTVHFGRCIHLNEKIEKLRRGNDYQLTFRPEWHLGRQYENLTRSQSSNNYATRVFAFGSNTNIPARYRRSLIFTPSRYEDLYKTADTRSIAIPSNMGVSDYIECTAIAKTEEYLEYKRSVFKDAKYKDNLAKVTYTNSLCSNLDVKSLSAFEVSFGEAKEPMPLFPLNNKDAICIDVTISVLVGEKVVYTKTTDFSDKLRKDLNDPIKVPEIILTESAANSTISLKVEANVIFFGLAILAGLYRGYYGVEIGYSKIDVKVGLAQNGNGIRFYDDTRRMVNMDWYANTNGDLSLPSNLRMNIIPILSNTAKAEDLNVSNYIADYYTDHLVFACDLVDLSRVEINLRFMFKAVVAEESTFAISIKAELWECVNIPTGILDQKGLYDLQGEPLERYDLVGGWVYEKQKGTILIDEDVHSVIQSTYPSGTLVVKVTFDPEDKDKYWSKDHPYGSYEKPEKYKVGWVWSTARDSDKMVALCNRGSDCTVRFTKEDAALFANGVTDYAVKINIDNLAELDDNLKWLNALGDADTMTRLRNLVSHHCQYRFVEGDVYEYLVPVSYFTDNYKISATRADYKKSLMLPTPESIENDEILQRYLDENDFVLTDRNCIELKGMHPSQFLETQVKFEKIYPNQKVTIRKIEQFMDNESNKDEGGQTYHTKVARYRFYIPKDEFPFKTRYILPTQTLRVQFQTGKLTGMEFDIDFEGNAFSYIEGNEGYLSYLIMVEEEGGIKLPNEELYPSEGDVVVFLNYDVTALASLGVVLNAEKDLLVETIKHLKQVKDENSTLTATLLSQYAKEICTEYSTRFQLGDVIRVFNNGYFSTYKDARIQSMEVKLDIPWHSPKFVMGDASSYSRLSALEGSEQSSAVASGGGLGGGLGGGISEKDAALAGMDYFLSKTMDDTAEGNIEFKQDITVGKDINVSGEVNIGRNVNMDGNAVIQGDVRAGGTVGSDAFITGFLGTGWRINRFGEGEMDSLVLRKKLVVPEIQFNRISVEAGVRWQVVGGGKLKTVIPDVDENGNELTTGQIFLDLEEGEMGTFHLYDKCQGVFHRKSTAKVFKPNNKLDKGSISSTGYIVVKKGDISVIYDNNAEPYVFRATKDFTTKVVKNISSPKQYHAVVVEGVINNDMNVVLCDSFPQNNKSVTIDYPMTNVNFTQYTDTGLNAPLFRLLDRTYAVETPVPNDLWERVSDAEANDKASEDNRNANFRFCGFTTIYFIVTEICSDDTFNGHIRYQLRCDDEKEFYNKTGKYSHLQSTVPASLKKIADMGLNTIAKVYKAYSEERITREDWEKYVYWKDRAVYTDKSHPQDNMSIAAYANHAYSSRQQCYYETTRYGVEMVNMTDWISRPENTIYVERELGGFTIPIRKWDTNEYTYMQLQGWGIAVGNMYYWGEQTRLDRPAVIVAQQLQSCLTAKPWTEVSALVTLSHSSDKKEAKAAMDAINAMGWQDKGTYPERETVSKELPYLYERWLITYDNENVPVPQDPYLARDWDEFSALYILQCEYAAVKRYFHEDIVDIKETERAINCYRYKATELTTDGALFYSVDDGVEKAYTEAVSTRNVNSHITFNWYSDNTKKYLWRTLSVPIVEDAWTLFIEGNNVSNLPRNDSMTLTAVVRAGNVKATELFDDLCFTWRRVSGQTDKAKADDAAWAKKRAADLHKKFLVVRDEDLYKQAEFKCKFNDGKK